VATGASHSYFGHPEWEADAPGLKTLDDALGIRNRFLTAFEEAEKATTARERQIWQTFVVVGGGPTGVELSGLLPEIEASTVTLADAGAAALDYVRGHVAEATAPVCGNSIGVDRRFLDAQLPELDGYLHYRSIDVSTLKELCRRWAPAVYRKRPGKQEAHRALADIHESILELAYYRDHFLVLPATEGELAS